MADLIQMMVSARIDPRSQNNMQRDLNRIAQTLRLSSGIGALGGQTSGIQASSTAINGLTSNISRLNLNTNTLNTHFSSLQNQLSQTRTATNSVNTGFISMISNVGSITKKFAEWVLVANLIYTPFRFLQSGIKTLIEIDKLMIDIAKVTELTANEMNNLAIAAANVGTEFGRTAQEFLQAAVDFSRAGLIEHVEELSRMSLLLANVGDMGIEDANKTIIATVQGMGLAYEDTINVIDKMDNIANKNATTVQNVSDGMRNFASTAKLAGLSLDETIALIGTGTTVLQKSGSEIGNALRTITMRITGVSDGYETFEEDISKAETSLRRVGIQVRESTGEFREPIEVLRDFAGEMRNLSEVEISAVTEALAGKMRANVLKGILNNFQTFEKQLQESLTSYGAAARENAIYIEGFEAKTKRLSATLTTFWQRSMNTETLKRLVDFAIGFVEFGRSIGGLPTIILLLAEAFAVLKIAQTATAVSRLAEAFAGLTIATRTLQIAMGALGAALVAATLIYNVWANKNAEAELSTQKLTQEINEQVTGIKNLEKEYKKIIETQGVSAETYEQLKAIQEQLVKSFGLEKKSIDLLNDSSETYIKNLHEINKAKLDLMRSEVAAQEWQTKEAKRQLEKLSKPQKTTFGFEWNTLGINDEMLKNIKDKATGVDFSKFGEISTIKVQGKDAKETEQNYLNLIEVFEEYLKTLKKGSEEYRNTEGIISKLSKNYAEYSNKVTENQKIVDEINSKKSLIKYFEDLEKPIEKAEKAIFNWSKETDKVKKDKMAEKIQKMKESMLETVKSADGLSGATSEVTKIFAPFDEALEKSAQDAKTLADSETRLGKETKSLEDIYADINKKYDDNINNLKLLKKAQSEMQTNNKLTASTYEAIIEKFPQLLQYKQDDIRFSQELQNAYKSESDELRKSYTAKMEISEEFFKAYIKGNNELWSKISELYGKDAESFQNIADVKKKINDKLLETLGKDWSDYNIKTSKDIGKALEVYSRKFGYLDESGRPGEEQRLFREEMAQQKALLEELEKPIELTFEPIDWEGIFTPDSSKTKADTSKAMSKAVEVSAALIEKQRYQDLAAEIERVNNLISQNKALQELSISDQERIKLLKEQANLYKIQQQNIHDLAEEQRKERAEVAQSLKDRGVSFTGTGDDLRPLDTTELLNRKAAEVNDRRADENRDLYDQLSESYNKLESDLKRYFELQNSEIPKNKEQWLGIQKTINEIATDIESVYEDQIKESIKSFNDEMSKSNDLIAQNEREMSLLDQNDFSGKIKLTQENFKLLSKSVADTQSEIDRLNNTTTNTKTQADLIKQSIDDLNKTLENGKITLREYTREIHDLQIKYSDLYTTTYNESMDQAKTYVESYISYIVDGIQKEITATEKLRKAKNDYYDDLIQKQRDEIDNIKLESQLQKEQNELDDIALKIKEQEKKIDDITKREKVKTYRAGLGFVYETDPRKLEIANKELADLKQEQADKISGINEEAIIKDKEANIEALEKEQEETDKGFENKINSLNDFISESQKIWDQTFTETITSQTQLASKLSELLDGTYNKSLEALNKFISSYNQTMSNLDVSNLQPISGMFTPKGQSYEDIINKPEPVGMKSAGEIYDPLTGLAFYDGTPEAKNWAIPQIINNPLTTPQNNVGNNKVARSWATPKIIGNPLIASKPAPFANEGYTGRWSGKNGKLIEVHPDEFVLNKKTVSSMLSGNLQSVMPKIPGFKQDMIKDMKNFESQSEINNYNVDIKEFKTNDAWDLIKQMRQLNYRKGT